MYILITGGAGFIGSHLCEKLIDLNHKIICIDNFNNYYNPKIKENNLKNIIDNKNFNLYRLDILNKEKINKIFSAQKINIIIHLAARAGVRPSLSNALLYEAVNVQGTINLLEACKDYGIKKFIFASSSSVYGDNKKVPFSEDDNVDNPVSPYAATKKSGELICYTYHHLYDISILCFRLFTVYGPRQRPEMAIHRFTRQILNGEDMEIYGDGSSSRDYTYIDDVISGVISSLDRIKGFEIINLGNSKTVKLMDLIRLIEITTGEKGHLKFTVSQPGDVFVTYADIRKARKMLKYLPKTNIKDGLTKFVEWYKEKREEGLFNE
ncbi:MAG: GDP-mannose 4,6-dehydratase [Actinobacteria bacterium]|nr:GDP-mannose 4,6-dehydratase [Actinomycetota bacterium]MBL7060624.1 GDP-mannose 4,6-dehydratase [Actinomycetota bacterium]